MESSLNNAANNAARKAASNVGVDKIGGATRNAGAASRRGRAGPVTGAALACTLGIMAFAPSALARASSTYGAKDFAFAYDPSELITAAGRAAVDERLKAEAAAYCERGIRGNRSRQRVCSWKTFRDAKRTLRAAEERTNTP